MEPAGSQPSLWRRLKKGGRRWGNGLMRAAFTGVAFLSWLGRGWSRQPAGREVKKILLLRLDLLGDLLLTMPSVAALRQQYPQAQITMLVLPYTAPVLELFPYVDRVLTFDVNKLRPSGEMLDPAHYRRLWRMARQLRQEKYDLAVSFYGLYAGILAFVSGAGLRIGYRSEGCPFLYSLPVPGRRYSMRRHEVEYSLALVKAAGAVKPLAPLEATIPASVRQRVEALLVEEGIGPKDILVACHPGSANGTAKRWPTLGWARLADRLAWEMGVRVVFTGVASEAPLLQEIVGRTTTRPLALAGKTSLLELATLLARCQVLVAGDTAPLHMAGALGTPVVGLYGPTDPAVSGPYGDRSLTIRKETPCSPCYDLSGAAECSRGDLACMEAITPEEVLAAVQRVLREPALMPGTVLP